MSLPNETWETMTNPLMRRDILERIRVPGGWLYRTILSAPNGERLGVAMTFVPEPSGWGLGR